eukprot:GFKZ01001171.1.p1 GENE.GFKZ01001171.1~~GFKZ01001171.1.p1  ORF type:complete len:247 (-),score=0.08 GFKZ01001171.1:384-1124(-)
MLSPRKALLPVFVISCLTTLALCQRNPCHPNRNVETLGSFGCKNFTLPRGMCNPCEFRGFDSRGNLNDCAAIYNIDAQPCKSRIGEYVRLNPCDTIRARQWRDFDNPANKMALDYFMYSICEECCDCIPDGSTVAQYDARRLSGNLISLTRGNCPAHAHFDICRIWPDVETITIEGMPPRRGLPKICPMIRNWIESPAGRDWGGNNNVNINANITRFLRIFNRFARCRNRATWQRCIGLESSQGRI